MPLRISHALCDAHTHMVRGPNCRAAIEHLPREPGIAARCQALGIDMHPADGPAPDTTFAVVRDYSVRTFSRADATEPREPVLIRATCCNRLAGPALDFAELPDARMHWAPLPHRGTHGIEAWHPQWICMRCHNELPFESVRIPSPTPTCPVCLTPMLWEVDVARNQERWVCSRCPFAHAARPFAPACRVSDLASQQPANPPAQGDEHGAAPAPAPALFQYTTGAPPPLPLRESTNSALYVPLLLDAAGLLTAQAQLAWRSRAPISEWWPAAVEALRARPFIPVDELTQALEHVALASRPRPCKRLQFNVSGLGRSTGWSSRLSVRSASRDSRCTRRPLRRRATARGVAYPFSWPAGRRHPRTPH